MFNGLGKSIGADAVNGALARIKELIVTGTTEDVQAFIDQALLKYKDIPAISTFLAMWEDIKAGYNSLTPAQKAAFWAAVLIMLTKVMAA